MRAFPLLLVVPLLAGHVALAQPQDDGRDDKPTASTQAPVPAETDNQAPERTDTPPLRDEYEPRERISKDKAESFPPDI